MVTCYFDESGGDDLKFIFVGGWVASVKKWEQFECDWKLFLAKFDVPYLHMREFAHSIGPYEKWRDKTSVRRNFMSMAAEIISGTVERGFISGISYENFEAIDKRYEFSSKFSSPYALTGRMCVALANRWRKKTTVPLDMEYVFEDGGPDKGGLVEAMHSIPPYLEAPMFKPGRDQAPSSQRPEGRKGLVQLQAADYLVYEMMKLRNDIKLFKTWKRDVRMSLKALPGLKLDKAFYTMERLERVCRDANISLRARVAGTEQGAS
jgi:hypothetical protein